METWIRFENKNKKNKVYIERKTQTYNISVTNRTITGCYIKETVEELLFIVSPDKL